MAIYLVNQGKTFKYEREGGYIWSPKLNKAGHQNRGYSLMKNVKKGDYIIHNSGGKLSAISIVKEDCKSGGQPKELKNGQNEYDWDDDGWVIYTKYYDFTTPLINSDLTTWAIQNYKDDSAFQKDGKLRLQYLCNLALPHAEYLIKKALGFEKKQDVIGVLQAALKEVNPTAALVSAPEQEPKKDAPPVIQPVETAFDPSSVSETSAVYHKAYGGGVVTKIADGKMYVKFENGQRIFQYPVAFEKGYLSIGSK